MAEIVARQNDDAADNSSSSQFFTGTINPVFSSSEFVGLFVLNGISMVCSLFVVVFIHMYRSQLAKVAATRPKRQLNNKKPQRRRTLLKPMGTQATMYLSLPVSLRLLFVASIIDVLYSAFRIYNLRANMPGFQGQRYANCQASMTGVTFFNLMSVFLRALLSVHLQLVILHNVRRALVYERQFILAALVVSLVLAVLPLLTHNYVWIAYDPTMHSAHCGYFQLHKTTDGLDSSVLQFVWTEDTARHAMRKGLLIMWSTNFAWLTLTVFYGVLVIASVIIRLVHQHRTIQTISLHQGMVFEAMHQHHEFLHMATKVTRRILQFPLMVVVCHILEVVYGMATLLKALQLIRTDSVSSGNNSANNSDYAMTRLYLAMNVMLGMEGIITLFFLPLEPPIRYMLHSMYMRRKSEIRRFSTISRTAPRRRQTEYWPPARNENRKKHVDAYSMTTISSVHSSSVRSTGATTGGDLDYTKWSRSAPLIPQRSVQTSRPERDVVNLTNGGPDHTPLVTFDYFAPRNCNSMQVPIESSRAMENVLRQEAAAKKMGVLRRATTRLRGDHIRKPTPAAQAPLSYAATGRPVPIHRSKTLDDFPWDVVAVPLPRTQNSDIHSGSDAHTEWSPVSASREDDAPQDEYDVVARGVMELRRDGLPSQQWYVPGSSLAVERHSEDANNVAGLDHLEITHRGSSSSGVATQTVTPESVSPTSSDGTITSWHTADS
ncbi:hypothetical protein EV175_001141 [Coemansia sp. RSA 1933]|nr:hypothetical protein EV175_001141 [Coemansia sp. RSA 1933]